MAIEYPSDYSNNFNKADNYREMVFRNKKHFTGNDANVFQSMLKTQLTDLADAFLNDGDLLQGGQPVLNSDTGDLTIQEGIVYVAGEIFDFPEATGLTIATNKEVEIGVYLDQNVKGQADDANMVDPSSGLVTSGKETQRRIKKEITWGWKNTDGSGDSGDDGVFYPVHLSSNGVLVISNDAPSFGEIDTAIAGYDRDSSGGFYVVKGLKALFDEEDGGNNIFSITAGKARINGFPRSLLSGTRLSYALDPDLSLVQNESKTQDVSAGEATIETNNTPISSVVSVLAKLEKTESVTRGVVADTSDPVAEAGIYDIVSIAGYTEGVDFQLAGGEIDWSLGGSEPSGGASYDVTYRFTKTIGIKSGSLTDTEFVIEDQDGGNEALIDSETCLVNYYYKLQRIDLLEMDGAGSIDRVKGIPHKSNPIAPTASPGKLPIALIKLDWTNDPEVRQVSPVTVPMGDLNRMQQQIQSNTLLIAELAQNQKAKLIDGSVHSNVFIDILADDSQRSGEAGDDMAISAGMLCLPITMDDEYPDNANNESIQTLDYTLENVVTQDKQTGQMKINPYDSFEAPPKPIVVVERVDNNVVQFTEPFVNRGTQTPQPPVSTPVFPEIPVEQVSPSLSIERAGAVTTVNPPASYDEALAQAKEFFQDNRHSPNKTSLNKKQKARIKNLAGNLLAGETVSTVKVNGKQVTVT